jgi:hypothetical protein
VTHQERDSFPIADRHPQSSLVPPDREFQEAASILDGTHGFGGAVWDAEMREVFGAKQKIENASAPGKNAAFQSCMHDLRESIVAEIERWAPEYVKLASAYPQLTEPGPIEWTRDRMQKVIDQRLRTPDLNGAIAFCLITISGGDVVERKTSWQPPNWMFLGMRPEHGIRAEHKSIVRRLNFALERTLARIKVDLVVPVQFDAFAHSGAQGKKPGQPRSVNRLQTRKPSARKMMRCAVMFSAIRAGLEGIEYCRFLHRNGISPEPNWASDGCPKSYPEAYEAGQPWQKRIQDEKYRAGRKLLRMKEDNPKDLEELLAKVKQATR